jgi:predicted dehydrogenase
MNDAKRTRVAVIGCGYWGPNLARNFSACDSTNLAAICDIDAERLSHLSRAHPNAKPIRRFEDIIDDS